MSASAEPAAAAPPPSSRLALLLTLLAVITAYRFAVLATSGLDLYVDEAQYWTWAQHLAWGYFSKPPVIAVVIAATTAVCGDGAVCVKSGAPLIYLLVALLIYAIARRLFDARIAFWSALVFFTLPGAAFSSMIISTDVPLFLCWTAALYCYLRALDSRGWAWWLAAGVVSGIGLLTKYTMLIFAVSVVLHLASSREYRHWLRRAQPYLTMLLAAAVFMPNVWWNAVNGWPTLHHTTTISGLESSSAAAAHGSWLAHLHGHELLAFLGGQFAIMGPVFLLAWIAQLAGRGSWTRDPRYQLLLWFAAPFLAVISLQALFGRANANWAAMVYASATIFVVARLIDRGQWRWIGIGIGFNVAVTGLAYHYDALARLAGVTMNRKTDVYKRVRGWDEFGAQAQALRAQHPGALFLGDSRDTLAELMYYVRPHPLDAVEWNPSGAIDDHYALTTTMADKLGRDFLYVSHDQRLPPRVAASFAGSEPLAPIDVEIHPDYRLDYRVWLLRDFRGYAPPVKN